MSDCSYASALCLLHTFHGRSDCHSVCFVLETRQRLILNEQTMAPCHRATIALAIVAVGGVLCKYVWWFALTNEIALHGPHYTWQIWIRTCLIVSPWKFKQSEPKHWRNCPPSILSKGSFNTAKTCIRACRSDSSGGLDSWKAKQEKLVLPTLDLLMSILKAALLHDHPHKQLQNLLELTLLSVTIPSSCICFLSSLSPFSLAAMIAHHGAPPRRRLFGFASEAFARLIQSGGVYVGSRA